MFFPKSPTTLAARQLKTTFSRNSQKIEKRIIMDKSYQSSFLLPTTEKIPIFFYFPIFYSVLMHQEDFQYFRSIQVFD